MKKTLCWLCVLCMLALLPAAVLADHQYLLDTNTRLIPSSELWNWDRESLSFLFNEIFARHGYPFEVGGKFYNWFNAQPWYQQTRKVTKQQAVGAASDLEWKNYQTIKSVISSMEASGWPYRKPAGSSLKSWRDFVPPDSSLKLTGFSYTSMTGEQRLDVYSAPSTSSWRGANGRAMMNTNGAVWAAGWEKGWLQVFYETNTGLRVGYVNGADMADHPVLPDLAFAYAPAQLLADCVITDDPLSQATIITTLRQGATVTYLSTAVNQNGQVWDYVETTFGGQPVRGYIRAGFVSVPADPLPNLDSYSK